MKTNLTYFGVFAVLSLAGCAGHGVSSSSSGQGSGQNAAPMAPTELKSTAGANISCVSPSGHMIGTVNQVPAYWSSPTAASQSLPMGGFVGVIITAVNSSGQIVGFANQGVQNGSYIPIYWSSPTATPVALQLPSGASQARCFNLNKSGQIVGDYGTATGGVYWPSPTSAPVALSGPGGSYSEPSQALDVSDSGVVFGIQKQAPVIWSSPQASPQPLPLPSGTAYNGTTGPYAIALNHATGEAGGWLQAGGKPLGSVYWAPPGYSSSGSATPSGFTGWSSINAIGPNHVLVGEANDGKSHAVVWSSPTAPFKNLSDAVPSAPGWTLLTAEFMTEDGTIIGQGMDPQNNYAWFVAHM